MNMVLKRKYTSPHIEALAIDKEISLIMMTDENTPPGGPRAPAASTTSSTQNSSSFQKNPFNEKKK
jgi:hypothetical protein